MKLSDFDYTLPKELIAQYPLKERDTARLLVLNRLKGTIEHRAFKDIIDYFNKNDLLVLNDTKVLPSRFIGSRPTGGRVEILLLGHKSGSTFNALIKPSRLKLKERVIFNGGGISCEVTAKGEVTFNTDDLEAIYGQGLMPLPPYIKRVPVDSDCVDYQTVYAKEEGAIASPTAGLHFTKNLIEEIQTSGINIAYVTLHVSYATFRPLKCDNINEHKMDKEYFKINAKALNLINQARAEKARIFAVGTTSCRVLETYAAGEVKDGETDLFIYPGYKFKMVDSLITNFHLPRTTLFMLVCGFAGRALIEKAYQEAIGQKYRFYSYGDAMLIL